jgi:ribosome-binding protein aMBF1 (putative translation factor)
MKSISDATSFRDLWENCITEQERQEITFQTNLIENLMKARNEKKMSQEELAEKAGMKQPAIARIENMKVSPQVDTLLKLLYPLGYTLQVVPISEAR